MAVNNGPAEGNGVLTFNTNAPGLETSLPNGTPSLSPCFAPFVDPQTPTVFTAINKVLVINGNNITIANPA